MAECVGSASFCGARARDRRTHNTHTRPPFSPPPSQTPANFAPPTVADTKRKFIEAYSKPVPAIYNTVLQELLVQQHFIRYSVKYQYNEVRERRHL